MTSCEPYEFTICYVNQWIWRLVPLPLIAFGTVGNIFNLAILSRRRMRQFSTTVYLIGLAVSDLVTIWTGSFPEVLYEITGHQILAYSTLCCQSLLFLSYSAGGYSVWLIVIMTVERMVLTVSPIMARKILSVRNAVIVASLTLVLFLIFPSPFIWLEVQTVQSNITVGNQSMTVNISQCLPVEEYLPFFINIWPYVIMFVAVVVPYIFIALGNGVILISLLLQKRRLRKINPTANESTMNAYRNKKSATKTLLLISAMFLITTFPMAVTNIIFPPVVSQDAYYEAVKALARTLTYQLLIVNYTFNFVLYCVSGTLFKQELHTFLKELSAWFRKVFRLTGTSGTSTVTTTTSIESNALQTRASTTAVPALGSTSSRRDAYVDELI